MDEACVIFLNGSYGVGKSTVLDHLGDQYADAGTAFALMDVDWFHRSWPPADEDPDNVLTEADNIAAAWANYQRSGPRQLVLAGVIETASDRQRYEQCTGLAVRSVRLEVDEATRERRLRRRYGAAQQAPLDWHLQQHEELARCLRSADLDELAVDVSAASPREAPLMIHAHFAE